MVAALSKEPFPEAPSKWPPQGKLVQGVDATTNKLVSAISFTCNDCGLVYKSEVDDGDYEDSTWYCNSCWEKMEQ